MATVRRIEIPQYPEVTRYDIDEGSLVIDGAGNLFTAHRYTNPADGNQNWAYVIKRGPDGVPQEAWRIEHHDGWKISSVAVALAGRDLIVMTLAYSVATAKPRPSDPDFAAIRGVAVERTTVSATSASGGPCGLLQLPYFRPGNPVTRGQVAKIVVLALGLPVKDRDALTQKFEDVPINSTFAPFIDALVEAGAVGGYPCTVEEG